MSTQTLPGISRCPDSNQCHHCAADCPHAPLDLDPVEDSGRLLEVDEPVRIALPPEYHRPEWVGVMSPPGFLCAACWGDGWTSSWPCHVAARHGYIVAKAMGLPASI